MKKYIFSISLMIAGVSQAQVVISEQANVTPTNSSVLLEFGTQPKGIILPSVSEATGAVAGTFIVNTTEKAVQYFDGTDWINLTYPETLVESTFVNEGTTDLGQGAVIGAETSAKPGVLVLESTTQAMVLPRVADPHLNVLSPVAGTMVYDTTSDSFAVYDGAEWSFWAAIADPSGILNGVTLSQNRRHWIASVFDTDYLPYTPPAGPASIAVVNANGSPEAVTVNHQGSISTTGIPVRIPVANVMGTGNIGEWKSTFRVPAMYAEDGQSRILELSWAAQPYIASTTYINATIRSLDGTFNAKKLDINAGIGGDYLGLLMGAFQYPYNNAGTLTSYEVRDIPGIPDRMFGLADNAGVTNTHLMLYLPIQAEDGNIWLNNNLGAHYSNLTHASFNPAQQATSQTDHLAYGSLFQWGRKPDGHELMTRTGPTTVTKVYTNSVTARQTEPLTTTAIVNRNGQTQLDWRTPSNNQLWNGENAVNNPCPYGFEVPSQADFEVIAQTTTQKDNTVLKLTMAGNISFGNPSSIVNVGTRGNYMTSVPSSTGDPGNVADAYKIRLGAGNGGEVRSTATTVRCMMK